MLLAAALSSSLRVERGELYSPYRRAKRSIFALASKVADKESSPPGSGIPVKEIERALKSLGERKRREIERALKSLSERERRVIELRYGLKGEGPWTCEEIGRHFGVTPQKIQMIDNQTHRKLMEACESDEDLIDLIAQWNSVFPEKKGRRWFFRRGRSRSR